MQESSVIADQATTNDQLGFTRFTEPIGERIALSTEENTPLTIGVYGEWGSGKTSFLMMVDEILQEKQIYPIWFNAWKYGNEENLWSALLQTVLDRTRLTGAWYERIQARIKIWWNSLDLRAGTWEITRRLLPVALRVFVVVVCLTFLLSAPPDTLKLHLQDFADSWLPPTFQLGHTFSILAIKTIVFFAGLIASKPEAWVKFFDPKLGIDFSRLKKKNSYREHVAFIDEFSKDFKRIVRLAGRGKPLVVIIDDLDRCLPEKALQVLEAIKLFMDVELCIFLLAVDRELIEKAAILRYQDTPGPADEIGYSDNETIRILGRNYFDKIVHLSVPVPPLSETQISGFILSLSDEEEVQGCAELFAASLPRNPRRIKRIIQSFLFLRDIAAKDEAIGLVVPYLLAKVVIVQSQFRDLYREITRRPSLLAELEIYYKETGKAKAAGEEFEYESEDPVMKALVQTYASQDSPLEAIFTSASSPEDTFAGGDPTKYVFLLRATEAGEPVEHDARPGRHDGVKPYKFFISYASDGQDWAEWIAWQLEAAGNAVLIQAWDFAPGSNFVLEMDRAAAQSKKTIAVLTPKYVDSMYSTSEWSAFFARDPHGKRRMLIPVRVAPVEVKGLLRQIVYIDLVDLEEEEAKAALLVATGGQRAKPSISPQYPGSGIPGGPRMPTST